jgi:hypothetical protein
MVSTWVRADFTAYLLTTHLQIGIWQAVENATYHPSFMVGWWVLV